jgi:hypothetical protein
MAPTLSPSARHRAIFTAGNYPSGVTNFGDDKPTGPSTTRITIWVVVGAVGLYFLISGIVGIVTSGG